MNTRFDYPHKTRTDFLETLVKALIMRRQELGMTQEDLNHTLGVADRLVSKWECGTRTPLTFHLYCWADALEGQMVFLPNKNKPLPCITETIANVANDNLLPIGKVSNDNILEIKRKEAA